MRRVNFIIIVFLLITANLCFALNEKGMKRPQNQPSMPDIVYRKGWALIIGIDKYPNLPLPTLTEKLVLEISFFVE